MRDSLHKKKIAEYKFILQSKTLALADKNWGTPNKNIKFTPK